MACQFAPSLTRVTALFLCPHHLYSWPIDVSRLSWGEAVDLDEAGGLKIDAEEVLDSCGVDVVI